MQSSMPQYSISSVANQQQYPQQQSIAPSSQPPSQHKSVFDPFDAIAGPTANAVTSSSAYATPAPASNTAHFDPNSMSYSNNQQKGSGSSLALSDADMNLFKF
jgi:hypothetical protein